MVVTLVLCADRAVLQGLAVTVLSALDHLSDRASVHVIGSGLRLEDKRDLRGSWQHPRLAELAFHDLDYRRLTGFRSTAYLKSKTAYARYFLGDFLPAGATRCLYLDTDLLVLRDLAELAAIDLEPEGLSAPVLAAVPDVSVRLDPDNSDAARRLGLADAGGYFNSGVLAIDLERWRRLGVAERLVAYSIANETILHSQDQDALNGVLAEQVLRIDPVWNRSQYERPDPIDGQVIHLIGTVKPWHVRYATLHEDPYYREVIQARFFSYLDRTAFSGTRPRALMGLGARMESLSQAWPTRDMVTRKLRNAFRR